MTRISVADIRGVVGIIPTPSLPGADRWDARDTVDLDETRRLVGLLADAGVDVILTNGTFGEGASLTEDETLAFNDAVLREVAGRVPVFAGATTLNTRDTIARGRRLVELGADGLFLGRPMWVALDDDQIVGFHTAVAEALPEAAQIVYDNPSAFKGKISTAAYARLAEIPQVVAAKYVGLDLVGEHFADDVEAIAGRLRLLPIADDWPAAAQQFPDEIVAAWSGDVAAGPAPVLALRDAIRQRDWVTAERIGAEIATALETLFPGGSFSEFSRYNIQIDRAEFQAAGYIRTGPGRLPYASAPEAYLEGGREAGRRWARLHDAYESARAVGAEAAR